jgi:thiol-disulfide isomerase/thioredoxin
MTSVSMPGFTRLRFWLSLLATAMMLALLGGCDKIDTSQSTLNGPQVSTKFFDAKFKDVKGNIIDLSALRGKTVVVNFWSTWCPPCVEEMPMFSEIQAQWKDKDVIFVGIAADQADNVKAFIKKTPVNYIIAVGEQAGFDLSRALGNRYDAVPFTLIINRQQSIVNRHFGVYTRKDLETEIAKAVK